MKKLTLFFFIFFILLFSGNTNAINTFEYPEDKVDQELCYNFLEEVKFPTGVIPFSKIIKATEELRGLRHLLERQFLKRRGWTEEEIAIKFAEREKGHQDIDHIVKTGERLKLN